MAPKPVVVGVDGSPESVHAAALAWRLAKASGAPCRPVLAIAPVIPEPGVEPVAHAPEIYDVVLQAARRDVAATLRDTLPAEVVGALDVRFGRPERVIAEAVAERGASLVVIGGKHHGALARGLGLSTAHHLVRMLEVPVIVAGPATTIGRIVVAVDLSPASSAALHAARELAQQLGARLRVLHVVEPLTVPQVGPLTIEEGVLRQQAAAQFQRLSEGLAEVVPADRVIREGDPADVIAAEAADWEADLLVVASHGKGWIDRVLLGSTTERLLTRLPCSLLVIPIRERQRARARTATRRRRRTKRRAQPV